MLMGVNLNDFCRFDGRPMCQEFRDKAKGAVVDQLTGKVSWPTVPSYKFISSPNPYAPCMVYLPTFALIITQM